MSRAVRLSGRPSIAAAILFAGLPTLWGSPAAPRLTDRPNVLVIVTDDQRADTLEVMPATRRWLVEGGTTFTQAYATTPLCCPSRSSIFSGRYAHNHGVRTNRETGNLDHRTTMQAALRNAGYQTGISGKFLLYWDLSRPPPHFDRWAITNGTDYRGDIFAVDGRKRRVQQYSTRFIADRALEFLDHFEADDARPWFLYVAPQAAHAPFRAEDRYAEAPVPQWEPSPGVFEADRSDKPEFVRAYRVSGERAARDRAAQLRTLMSVDDLVEAVARRLAALGEGDDTLVLFTSDNGFFWGEHHLRGKSLPYTEAIRVPLLLRWPGHVSAGITDDRLSAGIDIAPTALQAAGVAAPSQPAMDGRSLLHPEGRTELLIEYSNDPAFRFPAWASIRAHHFQYIEYYDKNDREASFREYYDLVTDPWQLRNLLGDDDPANDPPAARLSEELDKYRRCAGNGGGTACP